MLMVGDPRLSGLENGRRIDLVVYVQSIDLHGATLQALWHREQCFCLGTFECDRVYSLYGVLYNGMLGASHHLHITEETLIIQRPLLTATSFRTVKEVCAGIGGISAGLQQLGGTCLAVLDNNQLACTVLRANFDTVLEGDIAERADRIRLHQVAPEVRSMLCAGLPRHGYPRSGLGPGVGDHRHATLGHILQLMWHTQASCLVLEGPVDIIQSTPAMKCLSAFAEQADLQMHHLTLELADQWASHRLRWWAALLPNGLPLQALRGWAAVSPLLKVQDVIPVWPTWPTPVEAALLWDAKEQEAFANLSQETRVLVASDQAPAALHCWGCALRPCPCGCRPKALSLNSLTKCGSSGASVPSGAFEGLRFLHPAEAGLLNTLLPSFNHHPDPRAALCLVGQLAAPLQALWIWSQVLSAAGPCFGLPLICPEAELRRYKQLLVQQRQDTWLLPSMCAGGQLSVQDVHGTRIETASGPLTAGQLLCAEAAFLPPGFKLQLLVGDRVLPRFAKLSFLPDGPTYQIQVKRKAAALECAATPPPSGADTSCGGAPASNAPQQSAPEHEPDTRPATHQTPLDGLHEVGASDFLIWYGISLWIQSPLASAEFRLVPPCAATSLLQLLGEDMLLAAATVPVLPQGPLILIPFVSQGHWSLLTLCADPAGVVAVHWDGIPGRNTQPAKLLAQAFCQLEGACLLSFEDQAHWLQSDSSSCGVLLLAHAAALVLGAALPTLLDWAVDFQRKFPPHLAFLQGLGGLSSEQERDLQALLVAKGVPTDVVSSRLQAAVAKIGPGPLALALQQRNPWQALKTCASKPSCMFRWIQADELQNHIELQAQKKFGTGVPKAKEKKARPSKRPLQAPLHVDPAQLRLAPGTFVSTSGSPLGQLAFTEVQAQATGICFCTATQAAPFVAQARNLSVDPLALITTAEIPAEQAGTARLSSIRYPAVFTPTDEAVLVAGSLLQLGDDDVQLAAANIAELDRIDTLVCRLNLYKEECTMPWDKVAEAPIRTLLQQVPGLQVCKDPSCNQACGSFHAAVDEVVEHLFLDIWARQWCRLAGSRVKAGDADVFQAYLRVPASAALHLLRLNCQGLYFEPRASDGSGPHPAWSVVWLPGANLAAAQHALRTTEKAVALARLGVKYGLRTREADEQQVFEAHRPQHQFLKVRVSAHFRLHPLPHGLQRSSLVQLLKQWGWSGKPLQPDRGDSNGAAWLVGAACDPPAPALPLGTDYVLISKVRDIGGTTRPAPLPVYASLRTKKALLLDDDPDEAPADPWAGGSDPWSLARPPSAAASAPAAPSTAAVSKLAQIKADLKQDLQHLVNEQLEAKQAAKPPPGLSEHDHRLHQLEVGLNEVRQQNSKFEGWFQSFGAKVSDQAQQIETLTGTVKEQHQELAKVRTDVQATVQSAVLSLQSDLSAQMTTQLAGQLEQIQSLFADKKLRAS